MRYISHSLIFSAIAGAVLVLFASCGGGGGDEDIELNLEDYPYPVEQPEVLEDRNHFDVGLTYDEYTSNPPTSGPHAGVWAEEGIHDVAVPKEQVVHSMEHANAAVWYNCNAEPALSTEECSVLRNDLGQVVQNEISDGKGVVMTPYPGMDVRIALTAWGYLDTFEDFDEERVRAFIETFECNFDPEGFC